MLQNISISNKCSFELSINQIILTKMYGFQNKKTTTTVQCIIYNNKNHY